ncbi:MAG: hypothetical protein LBO67_01180 [Spirochaetaceae bacterium]|jgi:hypothetical protein|nr:hypothetical protein [Spirochaetaceae bacterium]
MKFLLFVGLMCYIVAVGYNIVTISNLDEKTLEKNGVSITVELASRLGVVQTLGILGDMLRTDDTASVLKDGRALREFTYVLFDWYAPIKWSPILSVSKEIGWLVLQNKLKE